MDQDQYINNEYAVNWESPEKKLSGVQFDAMDMWDTVSPIPEQKKEDEESMVSEMKPFSYETRLKWKLFPQLFRKGGKKGHLIWEKEKKARRKKQKQAEMSVKAYQQFMQKENKKTEVNY